MPKLQKDTSSLSLSGKLNIKGHFSMDNLSQVSGLTPFIESTCLTVTYLYYLQTAHRTSNCTTEFVAYTQVVKVRLGETCPNFSKIGSYKNVKTDILA